MALGLLLSSSGAGLFTQEIAESTGPWIALPGDPFSALIKIVVIPRVLSSIILGLTSSEDADFLRRSP
jgi:Na+/H+-dicarboxylate symporter